MEKGTNGNNKFSKEKSLFHKTKSKYLRKYIIKICKLKIDKIQKETSRAVHYPELLTMRNQTSASLECMVRRPNGIHRDFANLMNRLGLSPGSQSVAM